MKLHPSVTFVALILLQSLKVCFPTTWGLSGHQLCVCVYVEQQGHMWWYLLQPVVVNCHAGNVPVTLKEFEEMVHKDFAGPTLTQLISFHQQRSWAHCPLLFPLPPPLVASACRHPTSNSPLPHQWCGNIVHTYLSLTFRPGLLLNGWYQISYTIPLLTLAVTHWLFSLIQSLSHVFVQLLCSL